MKKNHGFPYKWGIKMRYVLLVIQVALFLPQWGHASNNVLLPGPKISFSMKDALMKDVIWELEKRSGFVFAYNANDLLKAGKVSVEVKDKDVYEALDICLNGTGLTYVVQQDVIVIKRADAPVQEVKKVTITGRVVDKDSLPLPGVTILLNPFVETVIVVVDFARFMRDRIADGVGIAALVQDRERKGVVDTQSFAVAPLELPAAPAQLLPVAFFTRVQIVEKAARAGVVARHGHPEVGR